jgi:hypothetical protein
MFDWPSALAGINASLKEQVAAPKAPSGSRLTTSERGRPRPQQRSTGRALWLESTPPSRSRLPPPKRPPAAGSQPRSVAVPGHSNIRLAERSGWNQRLPQGAGCRPQSVLRQQAHNLGAWPSPATATFDWPSALAGINASLKEQVAAPKAPSGSRLTTSDKSQIVHALLDRREMNLGMAGIEQANDQAGGH